MTPVLRVLGEGIRFWRCPELRFSTGLALALGDMTLDKEKETKEQSR